MSANAAIIVFFAVIALFMILIDVFTMLFRFLGLPEEKARFQVISLLTNSGYTTKECEAIVDFLPTRRLARKIMLFGYIFAISIISVFVNIIFMLPQQEAHKFWPFLTFTCIGFVLFMIIKRIPKVKNNFNKFIKKVAEKRNYGHYNNSIIFLESYSGGVLFKILLKEVPVKVKNIPIFKTGWYQNGVYPLFVEKPNGTIEIINQDTVLQPNEILTIFGPSKMIHEIFADI